ncbi:MAG: hypothetical protein WC752_01705 [Patescibacteria group bacterium]|jgi:hypothetical protein
MKKILLFVIFSSLMVCGCQFDTTTTVNANNSVLWVQDFISEKSAKAVENPPASISICTYQNEVAYYVPAPCCDQFSSLYSIKREVICYPGGGSAGQGDGRCPDFDTAQAGCQEIWRDPR